MSGLFEIPAGDERTLAAMLASLDQWKASGKVIGHTMRRALLDQAEAVDLARSTRRATAISGANKIMVEMLKEFGLLGGGPAPVDDPLQTFLSTVEAAANGGDPAGG